MYNRASTSTLHCWVTSWIILRLRKQGEWRGSKKLTDWKSQSQSSLCYGFLQHILSVLSAFRRRRTTWTRSSALKDALNALMKQMMKPRLGLCCLRWIDSCGSCWSSSSRWSMSRAWTCNKLLSQTGSCSRTRRPLLWGWLPDHTCMMKTSYPPGFDGSCLLTWGHSMLLQWGRWSKSSPSRICFTPLGGAGPFPEERPEPCPCCEADRQVCPTCGRRAAERGVGWLQAPWQRSCVYGGCQRQATEARQGLEWSDLHEHFLGILRFPEMAKVYAVLLCLPHSNADCEQHSQWWGKSTPSSERAWCRHTDCMRFCSAR